MIDPTQADIGRKVIYRPWPESPADQWEEGVITSINPSGTVFVRYGRAVNGQGTNREDLHWAFA